MKFTYYGHACFAIESEGTRFLFDPFIKPNPLAASIKLDSIRADYILISHAHVDHIADAAELAKQTGATVIGTYEVTEWLEKNGAPKTHGMNHGGAHSFEFGKVKIVNAIHSSSFPDGTYGGNPCGFVVSTSQGAFYYSGDTALTYDMKLVGEMNRLDFAVLCIGDNFTMGADDAAIAADFVRVSKVVGVHYDTFPPIRIDKAAAKETFKHAGRELLLPAIGETIEL